MSEARAGTYAAQQELSRLRTAGGSLFGLLRFDEGWRSVHVAWTAGDRVIEINGSLTAGELRALADHMERNGKELLP